MAQDNQQILDTLREIRDGQREIVRLLSAQHALAEDQAKRTRESIAESIGLQRAGLQRQRSLALIALPAIAACIAAIVYLVVRYF